MIRVYLLLFAAAAAIAQPPEQASFEVASVKPAAPRPVPDNGSGRKATKFTGFRDDSDPGRIGLHSITFQSLLARAYGVDATRVTGPGWIETELYDVDAKLPAGALRSETPAMLQNLLRERFRLQSHWEERKQRSYALRVAPGGHKLTRSEDQTGDDGTAKGLTFLGTGHVKISSVTMPGLATMLGKFAGAVVEDETAIPGRFDIDLGLGLTMEDAMSPNAGSIAASMKRAGLRMEPRDSVAKILVVDSAEKVPTAN